MRLRFVAVLSSFLALSLCMQAQPAELSKTVQEYVRVNAPKVVLTHVRVIDGTGVPAVEDQNVVIEGGKIAAIEKGPMSPPPPTSQYSTFAATARCPALSECTTTSSTSRGPIS